MVNSMYIESRKHGTYIIFILVAIEIDESLQTCCSTENNLQSIPKMINFHEQTHFPIQVSDGTTELVWSIIVIHLKILIGTHCYIV